MNRGRDKGFVRCSQQAGLSVALLLSLTLNTRAQSSGDFLPPPKASLVAVHFPDVAKLEAEVREQLLSLQAALIVTAKNPKVTAAALSEAYGMAGEVYQAYSLNSPARECYLNANRVAPQAFRWIYLLGKLDQQEGRADEAVQHFQVARRLRPDYAAVQVNLGNTYLQLNQLDDAKESFTRALAIDERCGAALYGLGQVALSQRRYAEAVVYFERTLALIPGANRIHYSLGMAYRGLGDAEKAATHLAQRGTVGVRVSDPLVDGLQELIKGERVHVIRGKLALESQRYAEAAEEFRKAIAANRDSMPAHVNLGGALIQIGDRKGAAEQFEEALRIDPKNSNAHYNLAFLLANEGQHDPAIGHLRSVLSVDPADVGARFFLGQELLKSGRADEALAEFSRVVEADPNNEAALVEQVRLLQRKKLYRQALETLEKGHAQYPQKAQTLVMLAGLLAASPEYDLRNGARALELAQLVYKATGSANHGAVVALALAELGRCDEASAWLELMITKATEEGKPELADKLKAESGRTGRVRPCRPTSDPAFFDR